MKGFVIKTYSDLVTEEALKCEPKECLWGDYWLKDQLAILFADSGTGKTVFAMDIAIALAGGKCWFSGIKTPEDPSVVAYVDLELSEAQAARRLFGAMHDIPQNLLSIRPEQYDYEGDLFKLLVLQIKELQARKDPPKVFIIDNFFCLVKSFSLTTVKRIVNTLRQLKTDYGLSILMVQHTHKVKPGKPLTMESMFGSKAQDIAADSIFALGSSVQGDETKYLKHLKARDTEKLPGVATLEIEDSPYLHFNFIEWSDENEHIDQTMKVGNVITPDMEPIIISMRARGDSYRTIAKQLGVSKSSVGRYCKANGI